MQHRPLPTRLAVAIAGTMLVGTLIAPTAYANDPLAPIINTVQQDREKGCHDVFTFGSFHYDKKLEAIAQEYARKEKKPELPPAGYQTILPFLGAGDPEAQAINRAYQHGARKVIGNCSIAPLYFGVGFVRHDDRSVDVVTIVFGIPNPSPPSVPSEHCRSLGDAWRDRPECGGVR